MGDDYLDNLKTLMGRWKKTVDDPTYQPSTDENLADKNYYNGLSAAIVGSVAPVEGILGEEAITKSSMDKTANQALATSPSAPVDTISNQSLLLGSPSPEMEQVARSQNAASKAVDMANRYKTQLSNMKKAALSRIRNR